MTTQDAVNPIESLDTWTECVEGKNKVGASRATEWPRGGDRGGPLWPLGASQACRALEAAAEGGDLSAVSGPQLPCLHVGGDRTSSHCPNEKDTIQASPPGHGSSCLLAPGWGLAWSPPEVAEPQAQPGGNAEKRPGRGGD